jgi:hypothetical protein
MTLPVFVSVTVPPVGGSSPAMHRRSVVFPAPDGPTTVTNSPSLTVKLTSRSTSSDLPPVW